MAKAKDVTRIGVSILNKPHIKRRHRHAKYMGDRKRYRGQGR